MVWISPLLFYGAIICGVSSTIQTVSPLPPADHLVPPPSSDYDSQTMENPSLMGRIAKWFGFGGNADEINPSNTQDSTASSSQIQQRYYDSHVQSLSPNQKPKGNCNPCNKVPWIPMFNDQQPLPILKRESLNNNNNNNNHNNAPQQPQYQQGAIKTLLFQQPPPLKSYSPHSHHPSYHTYVQLQPQNHYQKPVQNSLNSQILIPTYASGKLYPNRYANIQNYEYVPSAQLELNHNLVPIPVPNLSITPIPPIYGAKPFYVRSPYDQTIGNPYTKSNNIQYSTQNPLHQNDQIRSHIVSDSIGVSAIPNDDFKIVKSVSLGEFTSSIEYPPSIIQSPIIDLTENRQSQKDIHSQPEYISEPIVVAESNHKPLDNIPSASNYNFSIEKVSKKIQTPTPTTLRTTYNTEVSDYATTQGSIAITQKNRLNDVPLNVKKDRETPKDLLDSPIFYFKKTSLSPTTIEFADHNDSAIEYSSWNPKRLTDFSRSSSPFTTQSTPSNLETTVSTGRLDGPTTTHQPANDKKSKQIQIIIPYTSNKQPRPFKKSLDSVQSWSDQSSTIDFHVSEETKLFPATVTQLPKKTSTKYLTKVRASNLRQLLQKEKNSDVSSVDLSRLQKNIDGWTEQEFSMDPNKASTISLVNQSKHIPTEYLTTPVIRQSTTTPPVVAEELRKATFEPYFADEGYKKLSEIIENNHLSQEFKIAQHKAKTFKPSSLSNSPAFWDGLKLSISPITKEKVYVVTPQPWREFSIPRTDLVGDFKSPRFSIRPTPGVGSTTFSEFSLPEKINHLQLVNDDKSTTKRTPILFGQMEDAAFQPSTQVETIDGHSRVFTMVTPPVLTKNKRKIDEHSTAAPIN